MPEKFKNFKELPKDKKIIILGSVGVFLVLVGVLIYFSSLQGEKNAIFSGISDLSSKQIVFEVTRNEEDFLTGRYQYDKEQNITYFKLSNTDSDIEEQYYDHNQHIVYYRNIDTNRFLKAELDTSYQLSTLLEQMINQKYAKSFTEPGMFEVPYIDVKEYMDDENNLLYSYFTSEGIIFNEEVVPVTVELSKSKIQVITMSMSSNEGVIEIKLRFMDTTSSLSLPEIKDELSISKEELASQWIILYIQRIYATEAQTVRGVTDFNYLTDSIYKDEILSKVEEIPTDIRLRVTPSSSVESGMITGTITFESGTVINIEDNVIVKK